MKQTFLAIAVSVVAATGISSLIAQQNAPAPAAAQNPPAPPQTADPYFNNAAAGTTSFPLAAPAGKDSNARMVAPAGALN